MINEVADFVPVAVIRVVIDKYARLGIIAHRFNAELRPTFVSKTEIRSITQCFVEIPNRVPAPCRSCFWRKIFRYFYFALAEKRSDRAASENLVENTRSGNIVIPQIKRLHLRRQPFGYKSVFRYLLGQPNGIDSFFFQF